MSQPIYDDDISIMEDLDPEPSNKGRSVHARELILGVLLLVGVLGWAGWQWWREASLRQQYELGQQATIEHDWSAAYDHFDAARGYKDAAARAEQVEKRIEERDEQYSLAFGSLAAEDWAEGLQAARAVATIQPGYKDIEQLISLAERGVYQEALSGTVAQRLEVDKPGLYYYSGEGRTVPAGREAWTWLVGSDRWSNLRAARQEGIYVYDVPGPNWTPSPSPTPDYSLNGEVTIGSPELEGRRLVVATSTRGGRFTYREMALDPAQYNFYSPARTGVWALRFRTYNEAIQHQILLESLYNWADLFVFEAYDGNSTGAVSTTLSLEPGLEVADLGYLGKRVLLAEYINEPGKEAVSNLYVSGPDGGDRRLVYSTPGRIKNAMLSPDERFVLVTDFEWINTISGTMSATLFDLDGNTGPFQLAANSARVYETETPGGDSWTYVEDKLAVGATFLYQGYLENKLLIATTRQSTFVTTATLQLIDPLHVQETRYGVLANIPADVSYTLPVNEQADGNSLVIFSVLRPNSHQSGRPFTGTLTLVDYAETVPATSSLPFKGKSYEHGFVVPDGDVRGGPTLSNFALLDGGLLRYTAGSYNNPGYTTAVYTMPLADLGSSNANVSVVFSNTTTVNDPWPEASWSTGPGMFAYTTETGVLHARTFDGAIDLVLEPGVRLLPVGLNNGIYAANLR